MSEIGINIYKRISLLTILIKNGLTYFNVTKKI